MPPEVERELADEDLRMQRHRARAALWGHLGYVPLVSVIVAVGAGWYALALVAALAFNVVMIIFDLRRDRRVPFWLVLAGAVSVIAVVACMFSPFLIAPALAAVTGMFAAQGVFTDSRRSIVLVSGALIAAILLPLFGEWLGILPTTVTVEYGILHYRPPGLAGPPAFLWASGILYAISLIVSCVAVGRMMRGSDRGSRRQLHLQAWQLRQLMATS
jgi:hypothetical protein